MKMYLSQMDIMMPSVTQFGMNIQSLITSQKAPDVANLINILLNSEGFSKHHPAIHTKLGLKKESDIEEKEYDQIEKFVNKFLILFCIFKTKV